MLKADVLTLIADHPDARGVFDTCTETERNVYCTVHSVGMNESYLALSHGLFPEYVFDLAHDFEYNGEKRCRFHGIEYRIIRTYRTETDGIELTVERAKKGGEYPCITT